MVAETGRIAEVAGRCVYIFIAAARREPRVRFGGEFLFGQASRIHRVPASGAEPGELLAADQSIPGVPAGAHPRLCSAAGTFTGPGQRAILQGAGDVDGISPGGAG